MTRIKKKNVVERVTEDHIFENFNLLKRPDRGEHLSGKMKEEKNGIKRKKHIIKELKC